MVDRNAVDGKKDPGFLVQVQPPARPLRPEERVKLIRRGNELFNRGEYPMAKKIFLTTRYGDGLIRMGDYHYKKGELLEAFRMYWLAKERTKSGILIEKMALVIREWLKSDEDTL